MLLEDLALMQMRVRAVRAKPMQTSTAQNIMDLTNLYPAYKRKRIINKTHPNQFMDLNDQSIPHKIDEMLEQHNWKQSEEDKKYLQSLPKQFIKFLKQKEIPVEELTVPIPRYIRTKPHAQLSLEEIAKSLNIKQTQIVKIDEEFYALPPDVKINNCKYYQQGLIYGMDYSSCIPARALDAQNHHQVLELCSAPGNKSMYLADSLENIKITGVQISVNRANIMKNLVKKYKLDHKIQVKVEDAVTFDSEVKYDRVLIDAECTHEGSIKHIKKFLPEVKAQKNLGKNQIKANKNLSKQQEKQFQINNSNHYTTEITKANEWSEEDFKQRFLDEKKLNNLSNLQLGLIENGFRLLKNQGILVYSTCSFDSAQNQDIIEQFLNRHQNAQLMDCKGGLKCAVDFEVGKKKECIRFKPSVSRCGGMFISKIRKLKQKD